MEYRSNVDEDGRMPNAPRNLRELIKQNYAGRSVRVRITELKQRASQASHGYYRCVVLPSVVWALANIGNDINPYDEKECERVHRDMLQMHCRYRTTYFDSEGNVHERAPTLEGIPDESMRDYLHCLQVWAQDFLGIIIPDSDKHWKDQPGQLSFISALERDYPQVAKKYKGL